MLHLLVLLVAGNDVPKLVELPGQHRLLQVSIGAKAPAASLQASPMLQHAQSTPVSFDPPAPLPETTPVQQRPADGMAGVKSPAAEPAKMIPSHFVPEPSKSPEPRPVELKPAEKPLVAAKETKSPQTVEPVAPTSVAKEHPSERHQSEIPAKALSAHTDASASREQQARYVAASYRHQTAVPYPKLARRRGQEGTVWLNVQVDTAGEVSDIEVLESSGFSQLDQAALKTVRRWHFIAARRDGQAEVSYVKIPVKFQLDKSQ
ncbi:energy transducer TonB [Pontibacterium sinense]|uniref:energy transducer TonB n=1 Tax=Pontibacterium sinense TaxID=2781979 RepID=UPI001D154239|nr:energy transducer TonB [Pontibacterium sinense]